MKPVAPFDIRNKPEFGQFFVIFFYQKRSKRVKDVTVTLKFIIVGSKIFDFSRFYGKSANLAQRGLSP